MYGAVRKSFPNCLDIVSYKMLELKICYIKILPSKIKNRNLHVKIRERVLRYILRLNFNFRFHLFIYFLRRVCVFGCEHDRTTTHSS